MKFKYHNAIIKQIAQEFNIPAKNVDSIVKEYFRWAKECIDNRRSFYMRKLGNFIFFNDIEGTAPNRKSVYTIFGKQHSITSLRNLRKKFDAFYSKLSETYSVNQVNKE